MGRNRFLGITSRVLMTVAAGLLVLSYLSVFVNPARMWVMTVFGLLFIPLAILNLILLVWAVKRLSKSFIIPLVALLPALFFTGKYVRFSNGSDSGRGQDDVLRIVSYNVGRFASSRKISNLRSCADSIVLFLKSCDADVICMQEFHSDDLDGLKAFLSEKFKGYEFEYYMNVGTHGGFGNVTLSRFPAVGKGKVAFGKSSNMAIYTDYLISGKKVRVYNCHLQSYGLSLPRVVKSLRDHDRDFFRRTESQVKSSISRRPGQVDMILKDIASSPVEAFVCGDFNDTPMSYTYYRLSKGRSDSFAESGHGFGATYSFLFPMLRIDYILCPEGFRPVRHDTYRILYSDHYPVVADVAICDKP